MTTLINKESTQHYANKMVLAENRKVGSKSLPTALNEIDALIDEMKTYFDAEYGSALDMKLKNNKNVFSVGAGTNIDKRSEVENSFTDVELSGNSLANICPLGKGTKVVRAKGVKFQPIMKPNTTYTLISSTSNSSFDSGQWGAIICIAYPTLPTDYIGLGGNAETSLVNGYKIQKFTTKAELVKTFEFAVHSINSATEANKYVLDYAILLEGDHTQNPPGYFQGMKSVGQDDVNSHKIKILSKNRNEYEGKTQYLNNNATILRKEDNECIFEHRQINQGLKIDIEKYKGKEIVLSYNVELLEGSTLNWGGHNRHSQIAYYIDGIKQDAGYHSGKPISMEIGRTYKIDVALRIEDIPEQYIHDYKYVGIEPNRYSSDTPTYTKVKITNFQITQSRELYPYIQPKLDKKEISLNEPLRGIPNGVKDTIEKINGQWKIIRRCKEVLLNGKEYWHYSGDHTSNEDYKCFHTQVTTEYKIGVNNVGLSDKFPIAIITPATAFEEGIQPSANYNVFYVKVKANKVEGTNDANIFRTWVTNNPIRVIYQLATPIIEDIDPITLQCWKNGVISIDEVLPVETNHTVALNKSAQIKRNIEELTALRKKVEDLESFYDKIALEQAYQLDLVNHSYELDYNR